MDQPLDWFGATGQVKAWEPDTSHVFQGCRSQGRCDVQDVRVQVTRKSSGNIVIARRKAGASRLSLPEHVLPL
ncbi:hypothetical protein MHB50_05460 [Siminovitchia sp. FSL H7-0308]|uniref:Uncharacterized protein n=1 Tax=Siminovitchia thermophila TaxID=1245522 RepID=A0ABS2R1L2_9BACI|nr:hypothetical protein [Siminovitchia thermophila]MBM7713541.1 hypothetical protein [Siminovitchia thermophila]